jgi:hypothetical protein
MQDIEFTIQDGTLYMLQTRTGKRTGTAAVRIAVEMAREGLIDEKSAIQRVNPDSLNHLLLPQLDPKAGAAVTTIRMPLTSVNIWCKITVPLSRLRPITPLVMVALKLSAMPAPCLVANLWLMTSLLQLTRLSLRRTWNKFWTQTQKPFWLPGLVAVLCL